jgi:hypothetical protein
MYETGLNLVEDAQLVFPGGSTEVSDLFSRIHLPISSNRNELEPNGEVNSLINRFLIGGDVALAHLEGQ